MWHATWQKLHSQQLPRGANNTKSNRKWGHGTFLNKNFFAEMFFIFFFRDENQNVPKFHGRNAYLSLTSFTCYLNIKTLKVYVTSYIFISVAFLFYIFYFTLIT